MTFTPLSKSTPNNDGVRLERDVLHLLRILPHARLESHHELAGKDVDIYCELLDPLGRPLRTAIECKDYGKPLNRKDLAEIRQDYDPLHTDGLIDRLLIVTRVGTLPNAKKLLTPDWCSELSYSELVHTVLRPEALVASMEMRFTAEKLNEYYVKAHAQVPDLEKASECYDKLFNPFMDWAAQHSRTVRDALLTFETAAESWRNLRRDAYCRILPSRYDSGLEFESLLAMRISHERRDLETLVVSWANSAGSQRPLAVLGGYGTGKSSFATRIAYVFATQYQSQGVGRIPLLIELHNFTTHQDMASLITHTLVDKYGVRNVSFELFQYLNAQGQFLVILDGFDEMKRGMDIDVLRYNFHQLGRLNVGNSRVVVCGRPTLFLNDDEKSEMLTGRTSLLSSEQTQYIPVPIDKMTRDEVFELIDGYVRARLPKERTEPVKALIDQLSEEYDRNDQIRDLLQRPVHVAMLMNTLPDWDGNLSELRRCELYERFVTTIIDREIKKQKSLTTSQAKTRAQRKSFAADIAIEMRRLNGGNSIQSAEIPIEVFERYTFDLEVSHSSEATRRDLISGSFLDRHENGLLTFPHRSFADYLIAARLVDIVRQPNLSTDDIGSLLDEEVRSFAYEMLSSDDWKLILLDPSRNQVLLEALFYDLEAVPNSRGMADNGATSGPFGQQLTEIARLMESNGILDGWLNDEGRTPSSVLFRWLRYVECLAALDNDINRWQELLRRALVELDDYLAVHAFRALKRAGCITDMRAKEILGEARSAYWTSNGWFAGDHSDYEPLTV